MSRRGLYTLLLFIAVHILVSCEKDDTEKIQPETNEHNDINFKVEGTYLEHPVNYSGTYSEDYGTGYNGGSLVFIGLAQETRKVNYIDEYAMNYIRINFQLDGLNAINPESLILEYRIEVINDDKTWFCWEGYSWGINDSIIATEITNVNLDPTTKIISGTLLHQDSRLNNGIERELKLEANFDIQLYEIDY